MFELLESTLRLSTPLLFAAIGGFFAERSGVATICLEGVMLTSAWSAAVVTYFTGNPWLGTLVGIFTGALTMCLHGLLAIYSRADQIVSGVAVNLFAAGVTPYLNKLFFTSPTNTPAIPIENRFHAINIPLVSDIPIVGKLFFAQLPLVYLALLLPFIAHYIAYKTRWGLRLLASGDGPEALQSLGGNVKRTRLISLFVGGMICSLGGTFLSISHASQFTRDMTAGRGFIALAALIFGKWRPIPTLLACLFFGFADSLQIRLQSTDLLSGRFPVQFIQMSPYLITLLVLVGFMGKSRPPLSIGKEFK